MNRFWDIPAGSGHRFRDVCCNHCKIRTYLGKWLRHSKEAEDSIEEWLKYNNAMWEAPQPRQKRGKCLTDRPAHMTVDLYLSQDIRKERSFKRNAEENVCYETAKRRKID